MNAENAISSEIIRETELVGIRIYEFDNMEKVGKVKYNS